MKRVGFIGLGKMGKPMALNILRKGYELTIYDLDVRPVEELSHAGATAVESPEAVGRLSDVVITMLPNAKAVQAAVTGPRGLIGGMGPGSTLIDMSTSDPDTTRELAALLEVRGVHVLDAPVAKGIPAAEEGTLTIMAGGDPISLDACRSILQTMGTQIYHCGNLGAGQVAKIVNNLLVGVLVPVCAEALALGVKAGVDADTLMEVVTNGSGNSFVLDKLIRRHVLHNDYKGVFPIDYMIKDLNLATELGRRHHSPLLFGSLATQLYVGVHNENRVDDCYVAVAELITSLAGVEIRSNVVPS